MEKILDDPNNWFSKLPKPIQAIATADYIEYEYIKYNEIEQMLFEFHENMALFNRIKTININERLLIPDWYQTGKGYITIRLYDYNAKYIFPKYPDSECMLRLNNQTKFIHVGEDKKTGKCQYRRQDKASNKGDEIQIVAWKNNNEKYKELFKRWVE